MHNAKTHLYCFLPHVDLRNRRVLPKDIRHNNEERCFELSEVHHANTLADYEKWIANRGKLNAKNKSAQGE